MGESFRFGDPQITFDLFEYRRAVARYGSHRFARRFAVGAEECVRLGRTEELRTRSAVDVDEEVAALCFGHVGAGRCSRATSACSRATSAFRCRSLTTRFERWWGGERLDEGVQDEAQESLQPGENEAEVVADRREDDVGGVAVAAFEPAAAEMAFVLHVSDHRLDGGAASELPLVSYSCGSLFRLILGLLTNQPTNQHRLLRSCGVVSSPTEYIRGRHSVKRILVFWNYKKPLWHSNFVNL